MSVDVFKAIGVVVIGRNEGDRLKVCLASLQSASVTIVYVDSGSTDGSVTLAESMNANVVNLNMDLPFTAARARNEGVAKLLQIVPSLKFVQFVDGDCEISPTWFESALNEIQEDEKLAVVCGRRRERFPAQTFYNYMCDLEWNTPIGDAKACGGDALMRVNAFQAVGGFRNDLIAGEEPELCVRLRADGWKIQRIDEEMTLHDAAMTKFSQWWKRTERAGHAFAEGAYLHGNSNERHWVAESRRPWIWAFMLPIIILISLVCDFWVGLLLMCVYPIQIMRLGLKNMEQGKRDCFKLAAYSLIGKFAELKGQYKFHVNRMLKKRNQIIEYK